MFKPKSGWNGKDWMGRMSEVYEFANKFDMDSFVLGCLLGGLSVCWYGIFLIRKDLKNDI